MLKSISETTQSDNVLSLNRILALVQGLAQPLLFFISFFSLRFCDNSWIRRFTTPKPKIKVTIDALMAHIVTGSIAQGLSRVHTTKMLLSLLFKLRPHGGVPISSMNKSIKTNIHRTRKMASHSLKSVDRPRYFLPISSAPESKGKSNV
jgi:hypothetical protein